MAVPAALSGGPGVLLQQLLGSADLQLVVRSRVIHPHLKGQAVDGLRQGGHAEGLVGQAQLTEGLPSLPVEGGAVGLPDQKQVREVEILWGHPHEIPSDLQGGLLGLPSERSREIFRLPCGHRLIQVQGRQRRKGD